MSGYVGVPIDRNFLLLSAIYAIHCVLLHVFLQPIDVASVTIDKNYLITINMIDNNTNNYNSIKIIDNTYRIEMNSSDRKTTIIDENIVLAHQQVRHHEITLTTFFFIIFFLVYLLIVGKAPLSIDFFTKNKYKT